MRMTPQQYSDYLAKRARDFAEVGVRVIDGDGHALGQPRTEAELHSQIYDWCRERGWLALHGSMAAKTHRTEGEPDFIIAAEHGRTLYVECKSRTGKLSPAQRGIEAHLKKLGHEYHVVRSLAEFMDAVNKVKVAHYHENTN